MDPSCAGRTGGFLRQNRAFHVFIRGSAANERFSPIERLDERFSALRHTSHPLT